MSKSLLCGLCLGVLSSSSVCASAAVGYRAELRAAIDRGDYPKTTSILVVRNGTLVYESYFGNGRRSLLNDTRSAMKAVTALAVGAAIADGAIPSADAPAFKFFADLRPWQHDTTDKEKITLADLMSMSSALDCDDNDDNSPGSEDRMHEQQDWTRWGVDLSTYAGFHRDSQGFGQWRYCTINAVLAGQVVQRATHKPVDQYIAERIFRPLGIRRWDWPRSPSGEVMTGGGLRLSSRDIAKIAAMMADDGRWRGRQVVPPSWIEEMLTLRRASRPNQNYGYFIFEGRYNTVCGPINAWYMAGNGGSQILTLREQHTAIVLTRQNYNVAGTAQKSSELLEKYVLPQFVCGAAVQPID
jgi:CubicO group peptidase (beta-lactamase class C family)